MSRSGADLALLLLGGFRSLADAASVELAERGHEKIRPVHDFDFLRQAFTEIFGPTTVRLPEAI